MDENNLFTLTEFNNLKVETKIVTKTVHCEYIVIDGKLYEYDDLYDAVEGIDSHAITNNTMAEMLKKYGVIDSAGSTRWGNGSVGPNHEAFLEMIRTAMKKERKSEGLPEE